MTDLASWLMFLASLPAGIGGALLGAKLVDWVREVAPGRPGR